MLAKRSARLNEIAEAPATPSSSDLIATAIARLAALVCCLQHNKQRVNIRYKLRQLKLIKAIKYRQFDTAITTQA
jgi:hypothetical protein